MAGLVLPTETFGISLPNWVKSPSRLAYAIKKVVIPELREMEIVTKKKATTLSTTSLDDVASHYPFYDIFR